MACHWRRDIHVKNAGQSLLASADCSRERSVYISAHDNWDQRGSLLVMASTHNA